MKKYIDTNVFLRSIDGDETTVKFITNVLEGEEKYWVQNVVLSELVWILGTSYKYSRKKIVDIVGSLIKANNLVWTGNCDLMLAVDWFEKGLAKYNDCLIVSAMDKGDKIVSYEREFNRFDEIKRIEPKDLIG